MVSSKIIGLLTVLVGVTLQGYGKGNEKQAPRVHMFTKTGVDTLHVAKVFIKLDKEYELTALETFNDTDYTDLPSQFDKMFATVNEVFISQFGLKFEYEFETTKESEETTYPFLFDRANEKLLGLCETEEAKNATQLDAMMDARFANFETWRVDHPDKNRAMVLFFTGCSYTLDYYEEAKNTTGGLIPNWLINLQARLQRGRRHGSSTQGRGRVGTFCNKYNTGIVSLRRKYFKSMEKFIYALIHEMGHLLGADHVGLNHEKSLGIMDYNGGYYKGLVQFYNDTETIEKMTRVFDASLKNADYNAHCWGESRCPAKCLPFLGDGKCSQDAECKTRDCEYDAYDCNEDGSEICAIGCQDKSVGDGVCDAACLQNAGACGNESSDCDCASSEVIKKCLNAAGIKDKSRCIARCGTNLAGAVFRGFKRTFSRFRQKGTRTVDPWREKVPEFFRAKLGWWIGAAVILFVSIVICICVCCCRKDKDNTRRPPKGQRKRLR